MVNLKAHEISLRNYHTFRLDAIARKFCVVNSTNELLIAIEYANNNKLPIIILGGGSNIIFNKNVNGLVVMLNLIGKEVVDETEHFVYMKVCASECWDNFVQFTLNNNLFGLENLSLIPGTVGATPIQNIGAYGIEVKDLIEEIDVINLQTLQTEKLFNDQCEFSYRNSVFKGQFKGKYVITSVTFKLNKKACLKLNDINLIKSLIDYDVSKITPHDIRKHVIAIRNSRLPNYHCLGNAGSFFLNPFVKYKKYQEILKSMPDVISYPQSVDTIKISAGWLIDKCGWRGHRQNNCGVYDKNPLVLVNHGHATADELLSYANQIKQSVAEMFSIDLEIEPQLY